MPWKESRAVDERKRFIAEWKKGEEDFAELCRRFGIARETGYKWKRRYAAEGEAGLAERSRAPQHCPQAMGEAVAEAILGLRREHPRWGPRKLRAYLAARRPQQRWPAASTMGALLQREGLVQRRRSATADAGLQRAVGARASTEPSVVCRLQGVVLLRGRDAL
jgi:putative transposase